MTNYECFVMVSMFMVTLCKGVASAFSTVVVVIVIVLRLRVAGGVGCKQGTAAFGSNPLPTRGQCRHRSAKSCTDGLNLLLQPLGGHTEETAINRARWPDSDVLVLLPLSDKGKDSGRGCQMRSKGPA